MAKIKFNQMDDVEYIPDGGWLFQWCCDCHLRHVWHFDVLGNKKDGFIIKMIGIDDRKATDLRKFYVKHKEKQRNGRD